jgi:threonylcarbamoyladenosine tRNA methylthiotransferase MtaB
VQVDDIMSVTETAGHLIDGFGTRSRAYVQVQNGCDHRCTFCIIPFGRGNSRSVPRAWSWTRSSASWIAATTRSC